MPLTKEQLHLRQVLYNDAVRNGMFTAKPPKDFDDFSRRFDTVSNYADKVFDNYKADGGYLGDDADDFRRKIGAPTARQIHVRATAQRLAKKDKRQPGWDYGGRALAEGMRQTAARVNGNTPNPSPAVPYRQSSMEAVDAIGAMPKPTRKERQAYQKAGRQAAQGASQEYNRRNTPILRDQNDNPVIGSKTEGQFEDEQRLKLGDYLNSRSDVDWMVDKLVNQKKKEGSENAFGNQSRWTEWLNNLTPGQAFGNYAAKSQQYNKFASPEALWEAVSKDDFLNRAVDSSFVTYHDENGNRHYVDEVNEGARERGISPDDYVKYYAIPALSDKIASSLQGRLSKDYAVKDYADYLARKMGDSLFGSIATGASTTRQQRQLTEQGTQEYEQNLSGWGKAGGTVANLVAQAPEMIGTGGFGGALVKGGAKVLGKQIIGRVAPRLGTLIANGGNTMLRAASENVAEKLGRWGLRAGYGMANGVAGMSGFMAEDAMRREISTGEDPSFASIAKAGWEGAKEGAKTGVLFGVAGMPGRYLVGKAGQVANTALRTAALTSARTFSVASEAGVMTGQEYAEWAKQPHKEGEQFDLSSSVINSLAMVATFKGQHLVQQYFPALHARVEAYNKANPHHKVNAFQMMGADFVNLFSGKNTSSPVRLSKEDKSIVESATGKTIEQLGSTPENLMEVFSNPNIPWVLRQKISLGTTHAMDVARPRTQTWGISTEENHRNILTEYDKDGNPIERHPFKTMDEHDAILGDIITRKENNDLLAYIGMYRSGLFSDALSNRDTREQIFKETVTQMGFDYDKMAKDGTYADYVYKQINGTKKSDYDRISTEKMSQYPTRDSQIVDDFAQANGVTSDDVWKIVRKDPLERTDDEQSLMADLSQTLHDDLFKQGELHINQSTQDGADVADSINVNDTQNLSAAYNDLSQAESKATEAWNKAYNSIKGLKEVVDSAGKGADPGKVIDAIQMSDLPDNDKATAISAFSNVNNATAAKNGFMSQTDSRVLSEVNLEMMRNKVTPTSKIEDKDGNSLADTLVSVSLGETAPLPTGEGMGERLYYVKSSTGIRFREDGSVDTEHSDPHGMVILTDSEGNTRSVSANDPNLRLVGSESQENFTARRTQELQIGISQAFQQVEVPRQPAAGSEEAPAVTPGVNGRGSVPGRLRPGEGQGSVGGTAVRTVETQEKPSLSEERNEYGKPFVLSSKGSLDMGTVGKETGLTEAPIRLSEGEDSVDNKGTHHGYGLVHINAEHGQQILDAGYDSVQQFVEQVASSYTTIREGNKIAGNQTYLLELTDSHNNTLFIQLSKDGKYWNVNSAGIFRVRYSKNKPEVYTQPAVGSSSDTQAAGVNHGGTNGVTVTSGNSPETSDGKDNTSSGNGSENPVKISKEEADRLRNLYATTAEKAQTWGDFINSFGAAGIERLYKDGSVDTVKNAFEQFKRGEITSQQFAGIIIPDDAIATIGSINPAFKTAASLKGKAGQSLTSDESKALMDESVARAEEAPKIELTPENWDKEFGESKQVATPIGTVKMGDDQYLKMQRADRNGKLGMVKPTLENPDVIVEDERPAKDGKQERSWSYIFIKAFKGKDGNRIYYFTSVTVSKEGKEVVISSQERNPNRISTLLTTGRIAWINDGSGLHPTTQSGEPVPGGGSRGLTSTGSQSAGLGVNPPTSIGSGKDTQSFAIVDDNGVKKMKMPSGALVRVNSTGYPYYSEATPEDAAAELLHRYKDKPDRISGLIEANIKDYQRKLKKAKKAKPSENPVPEERDKEEDAREKAINDAQSKLDHWNAIKSEVAKARSAQAEAERVEQQRQFALNALDNAIQQAKGLGIDTSAFEDGLRRVGRGSATAELLDNLRHTVEREIQKEQDRLNALKGLEGVPTVDKDNPDDALRRGYRNDNGTRIDRPGETQGIYGKEATATFAYDEDNQKKGRFKAIEVESLQPSHIGGQRNLYFFLNKAQPKNRTDAESIVSEQTSARNIDPRLITGDGYQGVYAGSAPIVNPRGETIQGNHRGAILRTMYASYLEAAGRYRQYLIDHASEFGIDPEEIRKMKHPAIVIEIDVPDAEAIRLGQMTARDLETGGIRNIDPDTTATKLLSNDKWNFDNFASVLLRTQDPDASISDLIVTNGPAVIKRMAELGIISNTEAVSALDKGGLTAEAKKALKDILLTKLFKGGAADLATKFDRLPIKVQNAIATSFVRDFKSPDSERLIGDLQQAIEMLYWARQDTNFAATTDADNARGALNTYLRTPNTAGRFPGEGFSNYATELAIYMQSHTQKQISQMLDNIFDLVQGTSKTGIGSLDFGASGEAAKPMPLRDAVKKVLGVDYTRQVHFKDPQIRKETAKQIVTNMQSKGISISAIGDEGQAVLDNDPNSILAYHKVSSDEQKRLDSEPTVKFYRSMVLIDGKLYPPMSVREGRGKTSPLREPTEIGVWERSDENPERAKNGKFPLTKEDGSVVPAAYNPYFHASSVVLNDQFSTAYKRPNLVVVEVEVPKSELTSGYHAEGAKDAVGVMDWHTGPVAKNLPEGNKRKVMLSRYMKVTRILPDSEVAEKYIEAFKGKKFSVPDNTVTPSLRAELEKRGVEIVHTDTVKKYEDAQRIIDMLNDDDKTDKPLSEQQKRAAEQQIDKRLDEVRREMEQSYTQGGDQAVPPDQTGNPRASQSDGDGNIGAAPSAKVDNLSQRTKHLARKFAAFIFDNEKWDGISADNFIHRLNDSIGNNGYGQRSSYFSYDEKDNSIRLRISDHSGNARNIILRGKKSEKGFSIVILNSESDRNAAFKGSNSERFDVAEYVYDNPDKDTLRKITKGIFNAIENGDYVDIAGMSDYHDTALHRRRIHKMQVYHGSKAIFDAFDSSHMGEGVGDQVHGWGNYVAVGSWVSKRYIRAGHWEFVVGKKHYTTDEFTNWLSKYSGVSKKNAMLKLFVENMVQHGPQWAYNALKNCIERYKDRKNPNKKTLDGLEKIYAARDKEAFKTAYSDKGYLYTIDIPDNDGHNYLEEQKVMPVEKQRHIYSRLAQKLNNAEEGEYAAEELLPAELQKLVREGVTGKDVYWNLVKKLGTKKEASQLLSELGYKGVHYYGGRDGECYVVFNDNDLKITNRIKFFRTKSGEVYGFVTSDGKMYLDPRHLDPSLPIHEYGHLWAAAVRQKDPKRWKKIVKTINEAADGQLKPLFDEVRKDDPDLKGDDLAEEVLMRYSGKKGMKLLDDAAKEIWDSGKTTDEKQIAKSAIEKVVGNLKNAIREFWQNVADMLGIRYRNVDDIADHLIYDALTAKKPEIAKESIESIQPVGTGDFGPIYDQFKGNPNAAVKFLLAKKSGEAIAALHHKDIGDIDIVWGEEGTGHSDGYGLAKLAKYHPEVLTHLQEILDDMHVTKRTENRVQLESDTHQATVRLTWNDKKKTWLLTAFEKKSSATDNTTDTADTSDGGKRNGTATPQSTAYGGKDKDKSASGQETVQKFIDSYRTIKRNIEDLYGEQREKARDELALVTTKLLGLGIKPEDIPQHSKVSELTQEEMSTFDDEEKKAYHDIYTGLEESAENYNPKDIERAILINETKLQREKDPKQRLVLQHRNEIYRAELQKRKDFAKKYHIANGRTTLDNIVRLFGDLNMDSSLTPVFERVVNVCRLFSPEIKFTKGFGNGVSGNTGADGIVKYNFDFFLRSGVSNQDKASTLIHELVHNATLYALFAYRLRESGSPGLNGVSGKEMWNKLSKGQQKAVEEIYGIYEQIKNDREAFPNARRKNGKQYGLKDVYEMVAEIYANGEFREQAKKKNLWTRLKDAVVRFFTGAEPGAEQTTVIKALSERIDYLLEHPNTEVYRDMQGYVRKRRNDTTHNMFIGERGARSADLAEERTTRLDNLGVARRMEEAKKSPQAIKLATGWERGADGKWRYETEDPYHFKPFETGIGKTYTLGHVLGGKGARLLFSEYPQLKDMEVTYMKRSGGVRGSYTHGQFIINTMMDNRDTSSTILHEIQHAIQEIEGFAKGGSPYGTGARIALGSLTDAERHFIKLVNLYKEHENGLKDLQGDDYSLAKFMRARLKAGDSFGEQTNKLLSEMSDDDIIRLSEEYQRKQISPSEAYHRLAGEVESRNVQSRQDMTPDERRASLAADTEDVSRQDQIFLYGSEGASQSANKKLAIVAETGTPDGIVSNMHTNAEEERFVELTPENWKKEFGEDGRVNTPIGKIKMGDGQYDKLVTDKRTGQLGMIKPTLERPDVVLETYDPKEGADRDTKYLFIKAFSKPDGTKVAHFESVTVKQGKEEVSISSHYIREKQLKDKLKRDKILWNRFENGSETSGETQGLDNQTAYNPNGSGNGSKKTQSISAAKVGNFGGTRNNIAGNISNIPDELRDRKLAQLEVINRSNPMRDNGKLGVRSIDDIMSFDEALEYSRDENVYSEGDSISSYPDVSDAILERAQRTGRITVYSSHPIEDGGFVSPSMMMARDYAGTSGKIYSKRIPTEDVAWLNADEGQYAPVVGRGSVRDRLRSRMPLPETVAKRENILKEKYKGTPSQDLFVSLRNKQGTDYYGTVTEIARRVATGEATLDRLGTEIETKAGRYETFPALVGRVIASGNPLLAGASPTEAGVHGADEPGRNGKGAGTREEVLSIYGRTASQIEQWAKLNGCYFDEKDIEKDSLDGKMWKDGCESYVYRSKDGKSVIKITNFQPWSWCNDIMHRLDQIQAHNALFPDSHIEVIGYGKNRDGLFSVITKQPIIKGKTIWESVNGDKSPDDATTAETEKAFAETKKALDTIGFGKEVPWFGDPEIPCNTDGKFTLFDANNYDNIIIDSKGRYHVIDCEVLPVGYEKLDKFDLADEAPSHNDEAYDGENSSNSLSKRADMHDILPSLQHEQEERTTNNKSTDKVPGGLPGQELSDVTGGYRHPLPESGEVTVRTFREAEQREITRRAGAILADKKTIAPTQAYETSNNDIPSGIDQHAYLNRRVQKDGLDRSLGHDIYLSFMRDIYLHSQNQGMRDYVRDNLWHNNLDLYKTVGGYLADQATKPGNVPMWQDYQSKINRALLKAGYSIELGIRQSKYLAWLAQHPSDPADPLAEAERVAVRRKIMSEPILQPVSNGEFVDFSTEEKPQEPTVPTEPASSVSGRSRSENDSSATGEGLSDKQASAIVHADNAQQDFADPDKPLPPTATPVQHFAKAMYRKGLQHWFYVWKEAHIDQHQASQLLVRAILGIKKKFGLIQGSTDGVLKEDEDFLNGQNQLGSKAQKQGEKFAREILVPYNKVIQSVLPDFGEKVGGGIDEFQNYMTEKHSLERNRVFYVRDFAHDLTKRAEKAEARLEELQKERLKYLEILKQKDPEGQQAADFMIKKVDAQIATAEQRAKTLRNAADTIYDDFHNEKIRLEGLLQNKRIDLREYYRLLDDTITSLTEDYITDPASKTYVASEHDFSGLTETYGDKKGNYDDDAVIQRIMDIEGKLESDRIDELWSATKTVTSFGLAYERKNGLIDKKLYDHVSNMFSWYVPLRGFEADMAEDMYGYFTAPLSSRKDKPKTVLQKAKGRLTKADHNIFAQMAAMITTSIYNSLHNSMINQRFATFIRNNYNVDGADRLVTELQHWAVKTVDPDGNTVWQEAFPKLEKPAGKRDKNGDPIMEPITDPDEITKSINDFNADMERKQQMDTAKIIKDNDSIPYGFISKAHRSDHIVSAFFDGKEHFFVINGNPRAAQDINGMANGRSIPAISHLTRAMSQLMTTYAPNFIGSNLFRDATFSGANVYINEGANYYRRYVGNYNKIWTAFTGAYSFAGKNKASAGSLIYRYTHDKLNMNNTDDRLFKEFMDNGGPTGWTGMESVDKWKKKIRRAFRSKAKERASEVIGAVPHLIEFANDHAENLARFAVYMTSRKMGRSVTRSIRDAKQVSVNFQTKGAGWRTNTFKTEGGSEINRFLAAGSAQIARSFYGFYNAGIQGFNQTVKNVINHPLRTAGPVATVAMLGGGVLVPLINQLLKQFLDSDNDNPDIPKDPYANLPEATRRQNLCLYVGDGEFVTIPLGIEIRAAYGIGDIIAGLSNYPELKSDNVARDIASQLTQLLPIDFLGESYDNPLMTLVPMSARPVMEAGLPSFIVGNGNASEGENQKWNGLPIRRDRTEWNGDLPAWTRAFKSTGDLYVWLAKQVDKWTNDYDDENVKGSIDLDPAQLQHYAQSYMSSIGVTASELGNIYKEGKEASQQGKAPGDIILQLVVSHNMPVVSRFHYEPNEQNRYYRTRTKWFNYLEKAKKFNTDMKQLEKNRENPVEYAKTKSGHYQLDKDIADEMKTAKKQYDALTKLIKLSTNESDIKGYTMQRDQLMQNTVEKLDKSK